MNRNFDALISDLNGYLDNRLPAKEIVRRLNSFVSNDSVYDLPEALNSMVLALQDEAAYYVSDPIDRQEYDGYMGEEALRRLISCFLASVRLHVLH